MFGIIEQLKDVIAGLLYNWYTAKAPPEQSKHLPTSYRKYREYKSRYGIAPGDAITIDGNAVVVTAVEGPPTINATVTYYDLEKEMEYTTALANALR